MFSLFVGIIAVIMMLSSLWIAAGKWGVFECIGNVVCVNVEQQTELLVERKGE
mgnify:CR=1 FL=1